MFILWGVLLSVIMAIVLRKVPTQTPTLRFRHSWLVVVAITTQILIFTPLAEATFAASGLTPVLNTLTYALLVVFAYLNRKIWSLAVVGIGTLSNLLVIAANDGYMPVKMGSLHHVAGPTIVALLEAGEPYRNSILLGPSTSLPYLSDIFYLPPGLPLANVFSIGDVLIGIGAFFLIQQFFEQPERRT